MKKLVVEVVRKEGDSGLGSHEIKLRLHGGKMERILKRELD